MFGCYPLEACSFLMKDRRERSGCGVDLGGVEGGKTVFRLYRMRKESMLNNRGKIHEKCVFLLTMRHEIKIH